MAIQYKFYRGSQEFQLYTDAPNENILFFIITEVRGLDETDIQNGFDFIVGENGVDEGVYEQQLIDSAADASYFLEKWQDGTRLSVLVEPNFVGVVGTGGRLLFPSPGIPIDFDEPVSFEMTLKENSGLASASYFRHNLGAIGGFQLTRDANNRWEIFYTAGPATTILRYDAASFTITDFFTLTFTVDFINRTAVFAIDGAAQTAQFTLFGTFTNQGVKSFQYSFFDANTSRNTIAFQGEVDRIRMFQGTTDAIIIENPSTGVNDAGLNATVTGITQAIRS